MWNNILWAAVVIWVGSTLTLCFLVYEVTLQQRKCDDGDVTTTEEDT